MVDVNQICFIFDHNTSKVHGAKTNTPPKLNTYKCLPNVNTLLPRTIPHGVSDMLHSILGWFKVALG